MQVVNKVVCLTSAECNLFLFMGLTAPQGKPADEALRQIGADIKAYQPECAIDYANLGILEKLHNTLAVMSGQPEINSRAL
jgi:hypothetical protein